MTLKEGTSGQRFVIRAVTDSPLKNRLMTMGLVPGTAVTVLRSAPLGDPMALRVRSYHLALRRDDAASIQVESMAN
ncbi:MAG: ferrous iron transport protein A [Schwartzia sp.]|nr:ferrous iron transport protein A [Schwartzia sp. (in: firmicutes)]MBR1885967.1 ferrous iron transport protein A [Schwartzia sp. (in: firmicutes)]